MNYHGMLIYRERLRRSWSQEGLCKGICTVSYLSKIENGKAEPSGEILRLLLERLELRTTPELEAEAAKLCERAYELMFTGRLAEFKDLMRSRPDETYRATAVGLDFQLMPPFAELGGESLDPALETCMNTRQLALQRILQERLSEAIALLPNAYCYSTIGRMTYYSGDIAAALQYLQTGYDLAAREGAPYLMLECKAYMGNCCSVIRDFARMQEHYAIARRLAEVLGDEDMLRTLDYNTASTQLEIGQYAEAYTYLSSLTEPNVSELHKLAISCEKTGRTAEALAALDRAKEAIAAAEANGDAHPYDAMQMRRMLEMCQVVRYRLEHPDYLNRDEYGRILLDCFEHCRRELPSGFAHFHLPWVTEWYSATRQYKKAFELMSDFFLNNPV